MRILSTEFSMAILVMSIIVFFLGLFWYTIKTLNTRDAGKTKMEKKFRDLLNTAPDATVIVDNTGTIQMINLRVEELFWYKREDLIGKPVELLIPEELVGSHIKHMQNHLHEPRRKLMGTGMALMAKKRNGARFPVEISLSPLQTEEGVLISASIRDITDHWIIEQKLKQFSEGLEHQVLERTGELRQLSAHLVELREQERISISREIHDELGQQLTALRMGLVWLSKKTANDYELAKTKFPGLLGMVDEMVNTVRRISTELRPPILDHFGLLSALEWYSTAFEKRLAIKVSLSIPDAQPTIPADIATGIFRVYQEALTNIARHAEAGTVTTTITITDNKLTLTIADDGKGFDPKLAAAGKTLGLLGMRERILMMGGRHEITSAPGKGTLVSLTIPF